jgi:hypothetical protein
MSMGKRELRRHIYCHRGYWTTSAEQNSLKALSDASANGFGIDPSEINLIDTPIALNIKCDGLLRKGLEEIIRLVQDPGSFVFDGSIPEMLQYKRAGVKHALRLSEYEQELSWQTNHIWLDAFQYDWWLEDNTLQRLSENNFVVVVSPELHSREYLNVWDVVAAEISGCNPNVAICTDKPTEFLGIL